MTNSRNMLSSLPVEILEQIITYAREKDIPKLRQTCRTINAVSSLVTWRQVTITSSGVLGNALFAYYMDSEEPVELIHRYMEYIRIVRIVLLERPRLVLFGHCKQVRCEKVPKILRLIWEKASGIVQVNLELEQWQLEIAPDLCEWLHIVTRPLQRSEPEIVTVEYHCGEERNYYKYGFSKYLDDARSTVQMITQIKSLQCFNFKLLVVKMALDLNFFRDVGKYVKTLDLYEVDPRTIINIKDAITRCTSLKSLKLYFDTITGDDAYRGGDDRSLHTISAAQLTTLKLLGESSVRIRGTMPNLRVLYVARIPGDDPEAVECFKSLVTESRYLQMVKIDIVEAEALTQIVGILDRVRISGLVFEDISDVETIPDVCTTTMSRGIVHASIRPDDEGNTALVWHCLALLLEKLPGMDFLYFDTNSLPEYAYELTPTMYEVELDRVKQHLLKSSESE